MFDSTFKLVGDSANGGLPLLKIGDLQLKLQELARLQVELKGHRVTPRGVIEFPVLQQD